VRAPVVWARDEKTFLAAESEEGEPMCTRLWCGQSARRKDVLTFYQ